VIKGDKRKYLRFRVEHFYGQMATARGVGCNLRCGFCWINSSRDFPEDFGEFYSPHEVYDCLVEVSSNEYGRAIMSSYARTSGCEPSLGREHLLSLLRIFKKEGDFKRFLLETNGILFGADETYVRELKEFRDNLVIRLSFKAGTSEAFERKTGAKAEFFDLPFYALSFFKKYEIPYVLAAMSKDPAIMPSNERKNLLKKIVSYGEENLDLLEEERADPFGITIKRLRQSGIVDMNKFRKEEYLPINPNKMREEAITCGMGNVGLLRLLDLFLFNIDESSCVGCTEENPWHGHGVEDDLDPKLD